jgi:hypothetical protein
VWARPREDSSARPSGKRPGRHLPLGVAMQAAGRGVCTENLNPTIMVMKSAKDGA